MMKKKLIVILLVIMAVLVITLIDTPIIKNLTNHNADAVNSTARILGVLGVMFVIISAYVELYNINHRK
jgi:hypothetical protein